MSRCAAGYADHVDADIALAFVDDLLTPAERADVERRIDACAVCRGAIAAAARETAGPTKRERPVSAQPPPRSVELVAGETVGRYVVERPLGAGGMGIVSLARDPELRRAVVIKLVRPDAYDHDLEARLRREAQAMAQLSHPNVVQIFDIGRHGDRVFLAMEFIAGQTLDAWLIERARTVDEIIAMFLQAGAGLEAAHRAGLLHRDFKPTNVLVDRDGVAKVTDFGLARAFDARPTATLQVPRTSGVHAVFTHADAVIGTPAYMAPEQAAGAPLDARTDQYALALALLDALVGQHPARRTVKPSMPPAALEAALAKVPARAAIIRALAAEPAARWPDLAAFLRELAPRRRERRWWPLGALAAVGIAGVAAVLALRAEPVSACIARAPRAWDEQRAEVTTRLAQRPRAFAGWHAAHVVAAIDKAAAEIGVLEVAHCEAPPAPDAAACLAKRRDALAAAGRLIADDPWLHVRAIASCEPVTTTPEPATLRTELFAANAARARAIAERARVLGDDLLQADALDLAAKLEVAHGRFDEAANDFALAASVGERSGDDSLRGRALVGLLDLARMRGDLGAAQDRARQLDSMLAKHGNAPVDVFVVASVAATVWTELGDVTAAFGAIERATAAARTPDEHLRIRLAHARALALLRWDPEGAQQLIAGALAASTGSPALRAAAWAFVADLAFDRRDAAAAQRAVDEVARTGKRLGIVDELRAIRVRALADAPAARAALATLTGDATAKVRIDLARAQLQHLAGDHEHARVALQELASRVREPVSIHSNIERVGLSAFERAEVWFARCDVELALGRYEDNNCMRPLPLDKAHDRSPIYARVHLAQADIYAHTNPDLMGLRLGNAIELLVESGAQPLVIAELRLRLVRVEEGRTERKKQALAARPVFAAAGRTKEVAELDAILAALGTPAPRGDPWGP